MNWKSMHTYCEVDYGVKVHELGYKNSKYQT